GLQHQQPQLLDLHAGVRDPLPHHALLRQLPPEGRTALRPAAHELHRAFGHADQAHAVMDAARPEASLRDGETAALLADEVAARHPYAVEDHLGVAAVVVVLVPVDPHGAAHFEAGGVPRYQHHRLLAARVGVVR